jgi:hypothetical protein
MENTWRYRLLCRGKERIFQSLKILIVVCMREKGFRTVDSKISNIRSILDFKNFRGPPHMLAIVLFKNSVLVWYPRIFEPSTTSLQKLLSQKSAIVLNKPKFYSTLNKCSRFKIVVYIRGVLSVCWRRTWRSLWTTPLPVAVSGPQVESICLECWLLLPSCGPRQFTRSDRCQYFVEMFLLC